MIVPLCVLSLLLSALPRAAASASGSLSFLVLGDWGGMGYRPFTTPGQQAAAKAMGEVAARLDAAAVIALGDNFYSEGVTDVDSQRFEKTFEEVYSAASLQVPWFVTAGNHDYKGNVSAQLAYTQRSKRWNFPDYYYDHVFEFENEEGGTSTVHLVLIDTVILSGKVDLPEDHPDYFMALPGPLDATQSEEEWAWIEKTLRESTADYLIVGGHYPVWSVCDHGPTSYLVERLRPLLQQHGGHYLSGHDHCAMHIHEGGVHYMLAGIGDTCCYRATKFDEVPANSVEYLTALGHNDAKAIGGFTSMTFTAKGLTVTYYDHNGNDLYSTVIAPRH